MHRNTTLETTLDNEVIVTAARISRDEHNNPVIREDGEMLEPAKVHIQEIRAYRNALVRKIAYLDKWCADAKARFVERVSRGLEDIEAPKETPAELDEAEEIEE